MPDPHLVDESDISLEQKAVTQERTALNAEDPGVFEIELANLCVLGPEVRQELPTRVWVNFELLGERAGCGTHNQCDQQRPPRERSFHCFAFLP